MYLFIGSFSFWMRNVWGSVDFKRFSSSESSSVGIVLWGFARIADAADMHCDMQFRMEGLKEGGGEGLVYLELRLV